VKLQHEEPDQLGYLSKLRVEKHFKKARELETAREETTVESAADKKVIDFLKEKNMPEEVIREFRRSQVDPQKGSP
jgi:hypothetical protein